MRLGSVNVVNEVFLIVGRTARGKWHVISLRINTYGDNHNFLLGFWHILESLGKKKIN